MSASSTPARRFSAHTVAGTVYVALIVVLAAVAAWPIYRSSAFLVLAVTASLLGAAVAVVVTWRGWGGWAAAGLLGAVVLFSGVPLAVPSRLGGPAEILRGVGELLSGLVVGWKDLLTVSPPVGSYRNLLVPALVVFAVGTAVALLLSWRADHVAYAAVPVAIAMVSFGLLFGRTEVSRPWQLGPVALPAPAETAVGLGAVLSGVLWLAWRTRDERLRQLGRAADTSGVRLRRRASHVDGRRVALGAAMVAVAAVGVVAIVPAAAQSVDRTVLRAATGPDIELSRTVSPLTAYRSQFADETVDTVLFAVSGDRLPDRVRLATLDEYDGSVYRTGASDAATRFVRVPSERPASSGDPLTMRVVAANLEDLWMPTAGVLTSAAFTGTRAATLADGFYYSDVLDAAVETAGWQPGDTYLLTATAASAPALADAAAPGGVDGRVEPPATLRTWMQEHVSGSGGAALEGLVTLLRERGYLSHALLAGDAQVWARAHGDHAFVSSAAGHSLARVGDLFQALLEREAAVPSDGNLVAAVGDDEQFAVAVALMAQELGFPARVVVGTRLTSADPSLPVCAEGRCRAGDVAAWVEVRAATGEWIAVDVTPQSDRTPDLDVVERRDPRIGTQVRPDTVEEVAPPRPSQQDTQREQDPPTVVDLGWLWATLRVAGLAVGALAVVLGPFLAVLVVKAWRRRARRGHDDPATRIAGGWDEYVDAAADARLSAPRAATRTEAATAFGTPSGPALAAAADAAVFSRDTVTIDDAEEFWRIVDDERSAMTRDRWRRLRAAVSLRSFVRRRAGTPSAPSIRSARIERPRGGAAALRRSDGDAATRRT